MAEYNKKYSMHFDIACYMSDYNRILRPSAFLDCAQDIATKAAGSLDFGDTALKTHNCVWILARQQVQFLKPVKFGDVVRLDSWHKGLKGINFMRDYQMLSEDGEPMVNSTSSWIIMDIAERRLCRDEAVMSRVPAEPQSEDHAIEAPCPKVVMPRSVQPELIGTHVVNYSDTDFNLHANNVKYTVWAIDALPESLVYEHFLKELTINFNREARRGETVELYHAFVDGAHIIEGKVDGVQVFIEKLIFEE